jgi:hypothetical protein
VDWGWNPGTVEALGTAAAKILAAVAALLAVIDVSHRRKHDRRKQALLIGAWTEVDVSAVDVETGEGVKCFVHVANRSDLPVTDVVVVSAQGLGDPGNSASFRVQGLGPGQEVTRLADITDSHDALGYPGEVVRLSFVDQDDRLWVRDSSGLNELKPR